LRGPNNEKKGWRGRYMISWLLEDTLYSGGGKVAEKGVEA